MDPIITAAIATAVSGFSLFLAKYIITCLCPGRIECHPKLGCTKPNDFNCYIEKFMGRKIYS